MNLLLLSGYNPILPIRLDLTLLILMCLFERSHIAVDFVIRPLLKYEDIPDVQPLGKGSPISDQKQELRRRILTML